MENPVIQLLAPSFIASAASNIGSRSRQKFSEHSIFVTNDARYLTAQVHGQCRTRSAGRNGNTDITAPDDGRHEEAAQRGLIGCVDKYSERTCFLVDGSADFAIIRR